jgi:hypothetical protein
MWDMGKECWWVLHLIALATWCQVTDGEERGWMLGSGAGEHGLVGWVGAGLAGQDVRSIYTCGADNSSNKHT